MLELKNDDLVYMDTWVGLYDDATAVFGTIEGYAAKHGYNELTEYNTAIERGHATAWTVHTGVCLVGDKKRAAQLANERRERRRKAVCLTAGQQVLAEGRVYTVRVSPQNVKGPYNSDPISFAEVKK